MLIDNKKLNLLETQTTNAEKELQEVDGEDEISYDTEDLLAPPTPSTIYNWRSYYCNNSFICCSYCGL